MKPLKWTSTKPTKPGWYWWRTVTTQPGVYEVYHANGTLKVYWPKIEKVSAIEGEWAGPIPEPEPARRRK